jgi:hypothetical protein
MIREMARVSRAALMLQAIIGNPAIRRMFLPGTFFDPPRAGMMAQIFMASFFASALEKIEHKLSGDFLP